MLLTAVGLFVAGLGPSGHRVVLSVDTVSRMQTVRGTYRSINRWKTVQKTAFEGVPVASLLDSSGVSSGSSTVKLVAPDGYFWPPVGKTLTIDTLSRKSPDGLFPIVAFQMDGKPLDPEPDGTGPLRYVAPQFSKGGMNKPSWVSNLRVIEVRPFPKGVSSPDPKKVPEDQVWVVGNVGPALPGGHLASFIVGGLALVMLLVVLVTFMVKRSRAGASHTPLALFLVLALSCAMLAGLPVRSSAIEKVFSMDQLKAMPSFSGHYTFLKQLEPYTYYEDDYKGVALDTLLEQTLNLQAGASTVKVLARDTYEVSLSIDKCARPIQTTSRSSSPTRKTASLWREGRTAKARSGSSCLRTSPASTTREATRTRRNARGWRARSRSIPCRRGRRSRRSHRCPKARSRSTAR